MSWNNRVILHDTDADPENWWYGLHEVYYDKAGEIERYTVNAVRFTATYADGPTSIAEQLLTARVDAMNRPLLKASELPGGKRKKKAKA